MHVRSISLTPEAATAALELFEYADDGTEEVYSLIEELAEAIANPGFGGIRVALDELELEAALDLLEEYEDRLDYDGLDALASFESAAERLGWIVSSY